MLKLEPFIDPPITRVNTNTRGSGDISDESVAKIVKALQDVMKVQVFSVDGKTGKDSFDDSASFESIAKAMVKNTPSEANASSNIRDKVAETEHKRDTKQVNDIINTIREHD